MLMYKGPAINRQIVMVNVKVIVDMICGLCDELFNPICWFGGGCSGTVVALWISWTWFLTLFNFSLAFSKAILPVYMRAKTIVIMRNGCAILKCLKNEKEMVDFIEQFFQFTWNQ